MLIQKKRKGKEKVEDGDIFEEVKPTAGQSVDSIEPKAQVKARRHSLLK